MEIAMILILLLWLATFLIREHLRFADAHSQKLFESGKKYVIDQLALGRCASELWVEVYNEVDFTNFERGALQELRRHAVLNRSAKRPK